MLHALLGVAVLVTVVLDVLLLMYMRRYDRLTLIQRTLMPACRSRCVAQESVFRVQKNEFAQFSSVMGRNLTACHHGWEQIHRYRPRLGAVGASPGSKAGADLLPRRRPTAANYTEWRKWLIAPLASSQPTGYFCH